ncbi:MAG TPA: NUDIX domain-containing protein [Verrucomicrobiae bacterium]
MTSAIVDSFSVGSIKNSPNAGGPANRSSIQEAASPIKNKPRLGCAGVIRRGEGVLLGKRGKEPNRGLWVLPGGGVEFGESFENTLRREIREEAGIEIDIESVFDVYQLINPPYEHRVIVYLLANHRAGEPVPSSDLSEVQFFDREQLRELENSNLISPFVVKVLQQAGLL